MSKADPAREQTIEFKSIKSPPLEDIRAVLEKGLKENYSEVSVSIVECPDLTQEPFGLAAKGICGSTRLADVGGVPYLVPGPAAWRERTYNFNHVAKQTDVPGAHVLGACAGSKHYVQVNSECIPNIRTEGDDKEQFRNETHIAKIDPSDGSCVLMHYQNELQGAEFTLLGNLFLSEGKQGKVLKVSVKTRTGSQGSLTTCMRKTLEANFETPVGLGGPFVQLAGKVRYHIMPDFSSCLLNSDADVENWLTFHEFGAPFVNMATLISKDPGLDLRVEHTHGYSKVNKTGGHYHYDTTPQEIEYLGYFSPAEFIYRIDGPTETHMIGRD